MDEKIYAYAESRISKIDTYGNNSIIFQFYNEMFMKMSSIGSKIDYFYTTIFSKIIEGCNKKSSNSMEPSIVPHLSLLLGQIINVSHNLTITEDNLVLFFQLAESASAENRTSILSIILTFLYIQPVKVRSILIKKGVYENALKILLTEKFDGKLLRKIFVLGMIRLLEIEEKYFKDIMLACMRYLKTQNSSYHIKIRDNTCKDPKLRRALQIGNAEEDEIEAENFTNDYWDNFFKDFKHPMRALSEFDQFKTRMWQNMEIAEQLSETEKKDLR